MRVTSSRAIPFPPLGFEAVSLTLAVIVERSMHPTWLSNAYLVAAEQGGEAVFIDSGAPLEPLLEAVERGVRDAATSFIQKPFTLEALAEKVREVLDAGVPAATR